MTQSVVRPSRNFTSDNASGASKAIVDAIVAANAGNVRPYGADDGTRRMRDRFNDLFEREVEVHLVSTGTAANALALSALTPPWGGIVCHQEAHINNEECGAPEFFSAGAKLLSVEGGDGKIEAACLARAVQSMQGDLHSNQASCVSISQATERGGVYSLEEIASISDICKSNGLLLHMDGARFANAVASVGCSAGQMTWKSGIDILSFGASKNGTLVGEAIVVFNPSVGAELTRRAKRAGQLISKMRFYSAQLEAYLADDLWLQNARHANAMAREVARGLEGIGGVEVLQPPGANMVFCCFPAPLIERLLRKGFQFYYNRWQPGVVRLVASFLTTSEDVADLIYHVREEID